MSMLYQKRDVVLINDSFGSKKFLKSAMRKVNRSFDRFTQNAGTFYKKHPSFLS
jgi:hypothetical protein